jgi:hypothetical protein
MAASLMAVNGRAHVDLNDADLGSRRSCGRPALRHRGGAQDAFRRAARHCADLDTDVSRHRLSGRSPVTSRSNWVKDNSTLRVNRPIELVVLNCWVTETNDTFCVSKIIDQPGKIGLRDRVGELIQAMIESRFKAALSRPRGIV